MQFLQALQTKVALLKSQEGGGAELTDDKESNLIDLGAEGGVEGGGGEASGNGVSKDTQKIASLEGKRMNVNCRVRNWKMSSCLSFSLLMTTAAGCDLFFFHGVTVTLVSVTQIRLGKYGQ